MMYKMGHIPGSQYAGAAAKAEGLAALKKLVANLPRNQEIVIYCGCCPWDDCPNIRPAFQALKEMGFTNLKVLDIPERLGDDWTAKGFPIVKGIEYLDSRFWIEHELGLFIGSRVFTFMGHKPCLGNRGSALPILNPKSKIENPK